jgi:hypothetical protein
MKFSSLFVAGVAVAILSVAPAFAAPSGDAITSLPSVVVGAPKQHAIARSTVSSRTSAPQLASAPGGCVQGQPGFGGGCVTSFRSGDRPWVGCSWSGITGVGCRNIGPGGIPYKTYNQCMETGQHAGWRTNEVAWYCTSVALK